MRWVSFFHVFFLFFGMNCLSFSTLDYKQSQYPRLVSEDYLPLPSKGRTDKDGWYDIDTRLVHEIIRSTLSP